MPQTKSRDLNFKFDQTCQVRIETSEQDVKQQKTFVCNRFIYDDVCHAEVQTNIIDRTDVLKSPTAPEPLQLQKQKPLKKQNTVQNGMSIITKVHNYGADNQQYILLPPNSTVADSGTQNNIKVSMSIPPIEIVRNPKNSENVIVIDLPDSSDNREQNLPLNNTNTTEETVTLGHGKVEVLQRLLTCTYCEKSFQNRTNFIQHKKVCKKKEVKSTNSTPFDNLDLMSIPPKNMLNKVGLINKYCPKCRRTFKYHEAFAPRSQNTCKACKTNIIWRCTNCNEDYPKYEILFDHIKVACSNPKAYRCVACDYKTMDSMDLQAHIRKEHFDSLTCPRCGEKSKNLPSHSRHLKICSNSAYFKCKYCLYQAYYIHEITHHLKRAHKFGDEDLDKHFLYVKTENSENTESSKIDADSAEAGIYQNIDLMRKYCRKCKEYTKVDTIIPATRQNRCKKCNSQITWSCTKCKKTYVDSKKLRIHLRTSCANTSTFYCANCSYKCPNKTMLLNHVTLAHTDNVEVPCKKCNAKIRNHTTSISRHKKLCGNKPHFMCNHCGFRAFYKAEFRKHFSRVHKFIDLTDDSWQDHFFNTLKSQGSANSQSFVADASGNAQQNLFFSEIMGDDVNSLQSSLEFIPIDIESLMKPLDH